MEKLIDVDWDKMFIPSSSILEILIRGSLTYWVVFLYMRFVRRSSGQLNITDILLITLISDASQNAMAGTYESVTEGAALVGTLVGWDYLINWLGFRSAFFGRLGNPEPTLLVKNGVIQKQNLKRELITEDELISLLRQQGIEDVADVKQCYLEGSGSLSVIQKK
ncbi:DUF421 domain-containing protein [Fibrella forsythiae]|uniref:DUF421 domain-containing protein n=1 Tax=Fibrella forsythiae TaxID=2817061 RepID=A0ABS3JBN7_9BACT|nr:YetF domain-containing protein [Fibrella forsythiae]MBO0947411.1 DUF421 domain-containing protein [Fibrella forsythiae]